MAKIGILIPPQRFEIVRDRIGEILAEELAQQFVFHNKAEWNPKVWIERFVPFDKTETPAIVVFLADGGYGNKDMVSVAGTYRFYVDCLTASPGTADGRGDKLARVNVQRILGMARAILENPIYKTLDFDPPLISAVAVTDVDISDPQERTEGTNQAYGRLTVSVTVEEVTSIDEEGVLIVQSVTNATLTETELGYYYEVNTAGLPYTIPFNLR